MDELIIYVPLITPRIRYVFDLIFNELLKIKYIITTTIEDFDKYKVPKVNYSHDRFGNEFFIEANNLLFETGTHLQNITVTEYQNGKIFYQSATSSDLPFDLFSAVFYMVSRYEEYLSFEPDIHGRFEASQSLAFKNGFLEKPIVNQWVQLFGMELQKKYPDIIIYKAKFSYQPTIDVDSVFAFREKGVLRTILATLNDLLHFNFNGLNKRWQVMIGAESDPFDTFAYMEQVHNELGLKPIFFFLSGKYSKYDKNVPSGSENFKKIVIQAAKNYSVGIHPSYCSKRSLEILEEEKNTLSEIIGQPIKKSRQHFLLLHLPETYRNLINAGIDEDYTMGFASACGFRAGICSPFYFYDIEKEEITTLRIFPLVLMDVTLNRYMNLSREQAIAKCKDLINITCEVGGSFISLWHNESLSEQGQWKGWREVFEAMNDRAMQCGNVTIC